MTFNKSTKRTNQTRNHEGEKAYSLSSELDLYSLVVTSMISDAFYESNDERVERLRTLLKDVNPEFAAKLAVYAREKMYLRSIPLVIAVELAKIHSGDRLISNLVNRVIQRADEITEVLAYYELANSRTKTKKLNKLSKQIQKGVARAFNKFDEYQFSKYAKDTAVKFRDALFLVHPKAKDKNQQSIFDKIVKGNLETAYTRETEMSVLGQKKFASDLEKKEAFKAKWEEMIDSGKLGYMAILRNLRNILEAGVSNEHMAKVCSELSDPAKVRKSKQLPFRFLSAYKAIEENRSGQVAMVMDALEEAMKVSAENVAGFGYDTSVLIACDVSGSMEDTISAKSSVERYDIGLVLGMVLRHKCKNVVTGIFGDIWKVKNLPKDNILSNSSALHKIEGEVGYSTNGYLVIEDMINRNLRVDKVFIFTDCQLWNSNYNGGHIADLWKEYKKSNPKAKIYFFDLAGYGNTPISTLRDDVFLISGFSDKVFDMLEAMENGSSVIEEIKRIDL